jgi:succinate-acetate transporter protein
MVAGNLAGWYGDNNSSIYFAPFAAVFGGVAQFLAGMWAYKARETLATAMHGMWGSF